jgi:hypothetical protein
MRQTIDNWAFVLICAAFVVFGIGVFAPTGGTWCGASRCDMAGLLYGYQTLIVGAGAIIAAYYTVRATRLAARDQVRGMFRAAARQIAENKALLDVELAAERERTEIEHRLKGRAIALAILPSLMEMRAKAQNALTFIDKIKAGGGTEISRNNDTVHILMIPVPPALGRWSGDLYILGDGPGGDLIQLIALCELNNRLISESARNTLKPELHRTHVTSVITGCEKAMTDLEPIHDGKR